MIAVYSGDSYLARRAALAEAKRLGLEAVFTPPVAERVAQQLAGGLFAVAGCVVDLREADESNWKALKPLLEQPPAEVPLLLLDPKPSAGRSRWYKSRAEVHASPTPRYAGLAQWINAELKARDTRLSAAGVRYLAELDAGLEALSKELDKLELLTPPIGLETLKAVVALRPPANIFALVDRLTEHRYREALLALQLLLAEGGEPLRILATITSRYTLLARAWALQHDNPRLGDKEAASLLGVHPYPAKKALALAASLREDQIEQALAVLMRAEKRAKTGGHPLRTLERLLFELSEI